MSEVKKYTDRLSQLRSERAFNESDWSAVNRLALISNKWFMQGANSSNMGMRGISAIKRNRNALFDTTAVYALDRLSAALVSLLIPSGVKWHSLGLETGEHDQNEDLKKWLERIRDKVFKIRYTPSSGWDAATPKVLKSMAGFSVGVLLVEDGAEKTPITYRMMSVQNVFLGVNHLGIYNTAYREITLTAEQMVSKFNQDGDVLSPKVTAAAADHKKKNEKFTILHAVELRAGGVDNAEDIQSSKYTNHYIDVTNNQMIREGGYFTFPYIVFWWEKDTEDAYGTSPMIKALSEAAGLNTMGKDELTMYSQQVKPPYMTKAKGKTKRLNFNPSAVNTNIEWRDGRPMAQPMLDNRNINFAEAIKASRTGQLEKLLFINLFQILVDNGTQTATEALLRKKEKAEMLAPIGNSVRQSLSALIDREIDILARRGLFDGEFPEFTPPASLPYGADIQPIFVSPLDKARDLEEVEGTQQAYAVAQQLVAVTGDPAPLDWFDTEKDVKRVAAIVGHPINSIRTQEEVDQIRAGKEQQVQQAQMAEMAPNMAGAAKSGAEALQVLQEVGAGNA